jgi:hypothetical protein
MPIELPWRSRSNRLRRQNESLAIALHIDSEFRVEYGDRTFFPPTYYVRSVISDDATTRVLVEPPRTTRKARDRRMPTDSSSASDSCYLAVQAYC